MTNVMNIVTEDFVSFETAKLLKQKGFNEYCWKLYELEDCNIPVLLNGIELSDENGFWNNKYLELYKKEHCYINDICSAPTLQMVCKWLRLKYNLFIEPMAGETDGKSWFDFDIIPVNGRVIKWDHYKNSPVIEVESPEQAIEIGIKYCLESLI